MISRRAAENAEKRKNRMLDIGFRIQVPDS